MSNTEIVQKLWSLCNVLRDDGITYHQYVTELTYILFLKMMKETGQEKQINNSIKQIILPLEKKMTLRQRTAEVEKNEIINYSWDILTSKRGTDLKEYYVKMLMLFGKHGTGLVKNIYLNARTNIDEPKNLEKIIKSIDTLDWFSVDKDKFGDLYEGLLEKNASEKKSGAGQYFTPRELIDVITELIAPKIGELCNDPACGTFGFMIAAHKQAWGNNDNKEFELAPEVYDQYYHRNYTGTEIDKEVYRLALMNAMVHGIQADIKLGNTLTKEFATKEMFDVVLSNPPFGTKKGGEATTRSDLTVTTLNKQLNFLQHIYRSLKKDRKARAAVVLPDNVLFADGDGAKVREDLMNICNLHTILRLPTGIFYAQGIKTNVLFFTRGTIEKSNTKVVWCYDMRTNMPSFGKNTPLRKEYFCGFIKAYTANDRSAVQDERWSSFTREEIEKKNNSLDLGLIRDDSVLDYDDLQDPIENAEEIIAQLEEAMDLIMSVAKELKTLGREQ